MAWFLATFHRVFPGDRPCADRHVVPGRSGPRWPFAHGDAATTTGAERGAVEPAQRVDPAGPAIYGPLPGLQAGAELFLVLRMRQRVRSRRDGAALHQYGHRE